MPFPTKYARSGDISIAYQVVGDGPLDLVFVMGWVSHLDYFWEEPRFARFLRRLASFTRLILFDKRGTGLSDRVSNVPTLEDRMDDIRAVMDAAGSERAALFGVSEGGPLSALFAASYPERTVGLITFGSYPRRLWAPDYPWGVPQEEREHVVDQIERGWGGPLLLAMRAPSLAQDEAFRTWWATYLRMSASPGAAAALIRMNAEVDIRHVLPSIHVPTLIMHRTDDLTLPVEGSRYMAEHIPGARLVELPGADHLPFVGDQDTVLDTIEEFLTGTRPEPQPDRVLTTVLLTELSGMTETAARLGERRWREILEAFTAAVRRELGRFRGRERRMMGAGLMATFDGPGRAVHCASAIRATAQKLGIEVRAGIHCGECEVHGDDVMGPAVDIAARILRHARPGEILTSSTVRDLTSGSGLPFEDSGALRDVGGADGLRILRVGDGTAPADAREPGPVGVAPAPAGPLTTREREVAILVALGLSNRQIAEDLVIAVSTVERHIANILNKLDYHSRAQVAAWAVEQGLLRSRAF